MGYYGRSMMKAGRAAAVGYFIIIAMLLGSGAGWLVDGWLHSAPWGVLVGFLFGLAASAKELWTIARTTKLNDPGEGGTP